MLPYRLGALALAALLAAAALLASPVPASQSASGAAFAFGLIGDLGYRPEDEAGFRAVLDALDAAPLTFVIHVGDLWGGDGPCTDERYSERLALFAASAHPLIYTPGDNEWTDCHRPAAGGFDPLERLALLRRRFFADATSLGQQRLPLLRQSAAPDSAPYPENARWTYGDVTFLTVHVVGSNNNRGRTPEADAEYAARNAANLAWLRAGFAEARRQGSRGLLVAMQANPFVEAPGVPSGFADFLAVLTEETLAFDRPVVLVHGDTHYFRIDKPLRVPGTERQIAQFTRVETFGDWNQHWVLGAVDYSDPGLFSFRPRIVEANRPGR